MTSCVDIGYRGERNMHLLVLDVEMGVQYSTSTTSSIALASHFQFDFLQEAKLCVGGTLVDTALQVLCMILNLWLHWCDNY